MAPVQAALSCRAKRPQFQNPCCGTSHRAPSRAAFPHGKGRTTKPKINQHIVAFSAVVREALRGALGRLEGNILELAAGLARFHGFGTMGKLIHEGACNSGVEKQAALLAMRA